LQKQSPPPSRSRLRANAKKNWGAIPWDFLVALIIPRAAQIEFYGSTFPIFILLWSRLSKKWLTHSYPDIQNLPYPILIPQGFTKLDLASIAVPTETTTIRFSHLLSTGKSFGKTVAGYGRSYNTHAKLARSPDQPRGQCHNHSARSQLRLDRYLAPRDAPNGSKQPIVRRHIGVGALPILDTRAMQRRTKPRAQKLSLLSPKVHVREHTGMLVDAQIRIWQRSVFQQTSLSYDTMYNFSFSRLLLKAELAQTRRPYDSSRWIIVTKRM